MRERVQAQELSGRGFPAEVRPLKAHGVERYRVVIPDLRSRAEAQAFARLLNSRYGHHGAWALAPG